MIPRRYRQRFNAWEWSVKLLGLSADQQSHDRPGLVMVQIDGFSKSELEKALERNEMPFLKSLIRKEKYHPHPFYPGLPSTTPAVQGELFYGVKQAVPSFFFFDRESQKVFRMFDGESVRAIERRLAGHGKGLLGGGGSYSNIYNGGAREAHFCAGSLGWDQIWKDVNPFNFILLLLTHFVAFARMTFLCLWETALALMDFVYGLFKKEAVIVEFKFVPLRILLCILLRELIVLGVIMDIARGLPIIHLNFLGYDEQAHRRGPGSKTAHWALKGIDKAISRIYSAALHSTRRHYDVWIYSDHGQEATVPYVGHYGKSVDQAVEEVFRDLFVKDGPSSMAAASPKKTRQDSVQLQRARYLGKWVEEMWSMDQEQRSAAGREVVTAAMGPLGGVYVFRPLSAEEKLAFAKALVTSAKIPLVLIPEGNHKVRAWNEKGEFVLPEQSREVIDPGHPFFDDVVADLVALCHHPNAGTFTISGWNVNGKNFSFPFENGAHAGPGKAETDAFALLPFHAIAPSRPRTYLKTMDLRAAALNLLQDPQNGKSFFGHSHSSKKTKEGVTAVRIMTYNVHSCVGIDGRHSPKRIARVIGRYQPDIVALQELDIGRKRTGEADQPHLIAKELEMLYHFHPAIEVAEERYGNAVLSRYPVELVRAMKLPKLESRLKLEPRGAVWVSVKIGDIHLQIINAHLSFYGPECRHQAKALIGPEWLAHPRCTEPVILCGDFNSLPNTNPWRTINGKLRDVQRSLDEHRPLATWFGRYPIGRIDHVFVSPGIKVCAIEVPNTKLDKLASDHLPLIVDLEVT